MFCDPARSTPRETNDDTEAALKIGGNAQYLAAFTVEYVRTCHSPEIFFKSYTLTATRERTVRPAAADCGATGVKVKATR